MRTVAVLPVKRFTRAKQRLGASVEDPLRLALARAMVDDVMTALARVPGIERTIVVTAEPTLLARGEGPGAEVVADESESGQSRAASAGVARAIAGGAARVLCVPGDCPALEPAELQALLEAEPAGAEVVIVPDRHGRGTNGLLLHPPGVIVPAFGPGSFERHRRLASEAGALCRVERPPSLLLDIDTGADLEALRALLRLDGPGAARTRATLDGAPAGVPLGAGA